MAPPDLPQHNRLPNVLFKGEWKGENEVQRLEKFSSFMECDKNRKCCCEHWQISAARLVNVYSNFNEESLRCRHSCWVDLMNLFILFVIAFQRRSLKHEWAKGRKSKRTNSHRKLLAENIPDNFKYKLSVILEAVKTTPNLFWGDNFFLENWLTSFGKCLSLGL